MTEEKKGDWREINKKKEGKEQLNGKNINEGKRSKKEDEWRKGKEKSNKDQ